MTRRITDIEIADIVAGLDDRIARIERGRVAEDVKLLGTFVYPAVVADTSFRLYSGSSAVTQYSSGGMTMDSIGRITLPAPGVYLFLARCAGPALSTTAKWMWYNEQDLNFWGYSGGLQLFVGADASHPIGTSLVGMRKSTADDTMRLGGYSSAGGAWGFHLYASKVG